MSINAIFTKRWIKISESIMTLGTWTVRLWSVALP